MARAPEHHVASLKMYFGVFIALMVFTALTVAASRIDISTTSPTWGRHSTGGVVTAGTSSVTTSCAGREPSGGRSRPSRSTRSPFSRPSRSSRSHLRRSATRRSPNRLCFRPETANMLNTAIVSNWDWLFILSSNIFIIISVIGI